MDFHISRVHNRYVTLNSVSETRSFILYFCLLHPSFLTLLTSRLIFNPIFLQWSWGLLLCVELKIDLWKCRFLLDACVNARSIVRKVAQNYKGQWSSRHQIYHTVILLKTSSGELRTIITLVGNENLRKIWIGQMSRSNFQF